MGPPNHPKETKQYARYLREVKGYTLPQISKITGAAERTISSWQTKEKWLEKGEEANILEAWNKKGFLEEAAKQGMDMVKAIGIQLEGMTEPMKTSFSKDGDQVIEEDYATRHKYVKDFWNLSGLLNTGGKSLEINNEGGITNIQVIHPGKGE